MAQGSRDSGLPLKGSRLSLMGILMKGKGSNPTNGKVTKEINVLMTSVLVLTLLVYPLVLAHCQSEGADSSSSPNRTVSDQPALT